MEVNRSSRQVNKNGCIGLGRGRTKVTLIEHVDNDLQIIGSTHSTYLNSNNGK